VCHQSILSSDFLSDVIKVGLLGYGTVGCSLADLLSERQSALEKITGLKIELGAIAVRNKAKYAFAGVDESVKITNDAMSLVTDPDIDVVIELIGGLEPARSLILAAMESGKPVVTGNKELLANHGSELFNSAEKNNVDLLFEASTAGAIPILRPLRESLLGEDVKRIIGIVNGTTNYILTEMAEKGTDYADALVQAQELGYAEADPTADVEGHDSAAKAAIMASLAFGRQVTAKDVYCEGISKISSFDISLSKKLGYVIKLLAISQKYQNFDVGVRVFPALVPLTHPLASVRGSYNAVFVEGAASSELMFYGRGAGGKPTASAVLGDLVDAARNLKLGTHRVVPSGAPANIRPIEDLSSSFYVVLETSDEKGVLSDIAGLFAKFDVSIKAIEQESLETYSHNDEDKETSRMVFITRSASERDFASLVEELEKFGAVKQIKNVIRVIE